MKNKDRSLALLPLTLASDLAAAAPGTDLPYRVERCHVQHWVVPPSEVLPLLTVGRENEWAADFEPQVLFAGEGPGGEGSVFVTEHTGERAVWTTTLYDPESRRVEYFRVHETTHAVQIHIQLELEGDHGTAARIRYTYTALNEEGRSYVDWFTEEIYRQQMDEWETALNHYLGTGERLER